MFSRRRLTLPDPSFFYSIFGKWQSAGMVRSGVVRGAHECMQMVMEGIHWMHAGMQMGWAMQLLVTCKVLEPPLGWAMQLLVTCKVLERPLGWAMQLLVTCNVLERPLPFVVEPVDYVVSWPSAIES